MLGAITATRLAALATSMDLPRSDAAFMKIPERLLGSRNALASPASGRTQLETAVLARSAARVRKAAERSGRGGPRKTRLPASA